MNVVPAFALKSQALAEVPPKTRAPQLSTRLRTLVRLIFFILLFLCCSEAVPPVLFLLLVRAAE